MFCIPNKMSNHTLPHQNSVIQQPKIPLSHFLQQNAYLQFPKNTKLTNIQTLSHKTINYTIQIYQIQIYTKQKETFILSIIYLIPEAKVLKNLHSPSHLRTPKNTFPKTQVHLNSNALAFSSKRKRVFYKALWGFPLNSSAFSPEISLFTQIFPYLIT